MKAIILRKTKKRYHHLERLRDYAERHKDFRLARRVQGIMWNMDKKAAPQIAKNLKVSRGQVSEWIRKYQKGGPKTLFEGVHSGRQPKITAVELTWLAEIRSSNPEQFGFSKRRWTSSMVQKIMREKYNVSYHRTHIWKLCRLMQYSFLFTKWKPVKR